MIHMRPRALFIVGLVLALSAVACKKDDAASHVQKGDSYFNQGMFNESIVKYRRAIQLDGQLGETRSKLADAYARTNDRTGAIREYIRAGDLLPNDNEAQLKAGNSLLVIGRFEEARARAQTVLSKDPQNVRAQILRGNALAGLKDFDGAISDYESAVVTDPSFREAFDNLGTIQLAKGNKEEAETAFRKAVEVAPKSVDARLALANFFWAANRQADAESALKAALELEPSNTSANRALGAFYVATGRTSEAEPYVKTLASAVNTPAAQAS